MKDDVESMAAQARRSVTDEEGEALHSVRDFAWRLVFLGRVFDAMPGCQDLVRMEINILLDTFLDQGEKDRGRANWEKLLVSDFKCFSDVLTVVWNNQTVATQKNASSTINGMVGKRPHVSRPRRRAACGPKLSTGRLSLRGVRFSRGSSAGILLSGTLAVSPLEKLSETVVTLASTLSTLRSREVDPRCEEHPSRVARPDLRLLRHFQIGTGHPRVTGDHNESDLAEAFSGFLKRACVARSLDNDPPLALVNFFSVDC